MPWVGRLTKNNWENDEKVSLLLVAVFDSWMTVGSPETLQEESVKKMIES